MDWGKIMQPIFNLQSNYVNEVDLLDFLIHKKLVKSEFEVKREHIQNLINFLHSLDRVYDFNSRYISLFQNSVYVYDKRSEKLTIYDDNYESHEKAISPIWTFIIQIPTNSVTLTYYSIGGDGCIYTHIVDINPNWETILELYPDIDISVLAGDFANANEKLLILAGIPGTGKTHFIKYLIKHSGYKNIAYVKDRDLIRKSEFWFNIFYNEYDLLCLDDLDFELMPREKNADNSFISHLLSFSDGLLIHDTKIVITTNQPINTIDSALIRPGRCFDILTLNSLSKEDALVVWAQKLNHTEPLEFNKSTITQAELLSQHEKALANKRVRGYIKKGNQQYTIEEKLFGQNVKVVDSRIGLR